MARNTVGEWSETASNNLDVGGVNIAEGCAAANVNNAMREMMAQLAATELSYELNPDNYTGTDVEKIQAAYDYGVTNFADNEYFTIYLNRAYDLTGGSVTLASGTGFPRPFVKFLGGTLIKEDAGFMFDRAAGQDNKTNAPTFLGVTLIGASGVQNWACNCDRMRRPIAEAGCNFTYIGLGYADDFIQSPRMIGGETYLIQGGFLRAEQFFDLRIIGGRHESSPTPLVEVTANKDNVSYSVNSATISHNVIENYNIGPPVQIASAAGFHMCDNYLEGNKGDLLIKEFAGDYNRVTGSFTGNYTQANTGDGIIICEKSITTKNRFVVTPNHVQPFDGGNTGKFFMSGNARMHISDTKNYYAQTLTEAEDTLLDGDALALFDFTVGPSDVGAGTGCEILVSDFFRTGDAAYHDQAMQSTFMVSITGQSNDASSNYTYQYQGIMTIASKNFADVGDGTSGIRAEIKLTHLAGENTNGSVGGGTLTDPTDVLVRWATADVNAGELGTVRERKAFTSGTQFRFVLQNVTDLLTKVQIIPLNNVVQNGFSPYTYSG